MNGKKLCGLFLAFLSSFIFINRAHSQCSNHQPTEYGKDLLADMIHNPPHRWSGNDMDYWTHANVWYWYQSDIVAAQNQWNNSSYKGTATTFSFDRIGSKSGGAYVAGERDFLNFMGYANLTSVRYKDVDCTEAHRVME